MSTATSENTASRLNKSVLKRAAIIIFMVATLAATIIVSTYNNNKAAAFKESALEVSEECEAVKEEISEKSDLIAGKGFDEYCEKIAREKYGYAKPGEYVIYDSSFGK